MNNKFVATSMRKFLKLMGVNFNTKTSRHLTVMIDDSISAIGVITPIDFAMSNDTMVNVINRITHFGFIGFQIARAMIDAINSLQPDDSDNLRNLCFVRQYEPIDAIKYFTEWLFQTIEINGVRINRKNITRNSMRNIWFSFGGYRGIKTLFKKGLTVTIDEFSRLRTIEEKLEINSVIDIDNPYLETFVDDLRAYELKPVQEQVCLHQCLTCSHCKTDNYGSHICKIGYLDIPDNLTVGEVNKLYPKTKMFDYGNLQSQYILFTQQECASYHSRTV